MANKLNRVQFHRLSMVLEAQAEMLLKGIELETYSEQVSKVVGFSVSADCVRNALEELGIPYKTLAGIAREKAEEERRNQLRRVAESVLGEALDARARGLEGRLAALEAALEAGGRAGAAAELLARLEALEAAVKAERNDRLHLEARVADRDTQLLQAVEDTDALRRRVEAELAALRGAAAGLYRHLKLQPPAGSGILTGGTQPRRVI